MNTINTKIDTITNPNTADSHEYIIMGKSLADRYINAGMTQNKPDMWDLTDCISSNYLYAMGSYLCSQHDDTFKGVLVVNVEMLANDAFTANLMRGAEFDRVRYSQSHECPYNDNTKEWCKWGLLDCHDQIKPVHDIEQLTISPNSYIHALKFGRGRLGNYLMTVCLNNGKLCSFIIDGYDHIKSVVYDKLKGRYTPIQWLAISKRNDKEHLQIARKGLDNSASITITDLQAFINPPPHNAQNLPSHLPKSPFNGQSGRTGIYSVLIILLISLLLLPYQCAVAYTGILSKTNSGQASRDTLAFFVSDNCLASQAKQYTSTAPILYPACQQGNTVYDGVTSQNTRALGRICGAVSICTESEPRHLMPIDINSAYSVALTQKQIGGSYHG